MGLSDLAMSFMPQQVRGKRQSVYQTGVASIQTYLDGLEKGKKSLEDFNKAFANADQGIRNHAREIRNDVGALETYSDSLNVASEKLSESGWAAMKAAVQQGLYNAAVKAAKFALDTIVSMGVSWVVTSGISWLVDRADDIIHASEKIAEAAEEAESKIADVRDTTKTAHDTVLGASETGGIAEEFAKLSQGVSAAGGNLSLTSDEYERYLELSNQLADLFPTLSRHYDANGNAIVSLKGNVDDIVASLRDLVKTAQELGNQQILDEAPTVFKDVQQKIDQAKRDYLDKSVAGFADAITVHNDAKSAWDRYVSGEGNIGDVLKDLVTGSGKETAGIGTVSIPFEVDPELSTTTASYRLSEQLKNLGVDILSSHRDGNRLVYEIPEEDLPVIEANIDSIDWEFDPQALTDYQNAVQQQITRMMPFVSAQLNSDVTYAGFSDVGKQIVTEIASGIDPTMFNSDAEWLQAIKDDVVGVYSELMNSDYALCVTERHGGIISVVERSVGFFFREFKCVPFRKIVF